jgi:ATP-dependent Lon protease
MKSADAASAIKIPATLPLLPLDDIVVFPFVIVPVVVSEPRQLEMVNKVISSDKMLAVFSKRSSEKIGGERRFYDTGCAAVVLKMFKMKNGEVGLLLQGLARVQLDDLVRRDPYLEGKLTIMREDSRSSLKIEALRKELKRKFQILAQHRNMVKEDVQSAILNIEEPGKLCDVIVSNLPVTVEERQHVLDTVVIQKRLRDTTHLLQREIELLELSQQIKASVDEEIEVSEKQRYLRAQINMMQKELGEGDSGEDLEQMLADAQQSGMSGEALQAVEKEIRRMRTMSNSSADYHVLRGYVEWMIDLPWQKRDTKPLNIKRAATVLNRDHYGLDEVKNRILEFLAVKELNPQTRTPILCLVGPPGVGKTSLGQSIASALNRQFTRLALGGVHDEAEVRGHRKTYVGAFPGRIIQRLRDAGTRNPVFMLDEIDKLGKDTKGDPASALLEVLDPEQNSEFMDHYLDVKFDLSEVVFITTANQPYDIPEPLLDRMEVIHLPGYLKQEKVQIARRYLIPRQIENSGLSKKHIQLSAAGLNAVISEYTREAGVRNLEQRIGALCRKTARQVLANPATRARVSSRNLADYLGPPRFQGTQRRKKMQAGVATGLAWTPYGGVILHIETTLMPGGRNLKLTGQLGDVMRESAETALSYLRANSAHFKLPEKFFSEHDIHVHIPAGATPKDGPSAGTTLIMALLSLLWNKPLPGGIAMTGEVTLTGEVMPVGGIREKLLAASENQMRHVLIPASNKSDLEEVPAEVKRNLKITLVEKITDIVDALYPEKK